MLRKPFLKWAGGKYRLLDRILHELPGGSRLVEPFAGSCAVYLNAPFRKAFVCDVNEDLISLYKHVQKEGHEFISCCEELFSPDSNTKERYLELRSEFNTTQEARRKAALLLYLNRHSFNGLVRYNLKGQFNTPFGRYEKPYFPGKELQDFHQKTLEAETVFSCCDFRTVFAQLEEGDVVYCDPPYVPLSATSSFTAYASADFSLQDQRDLAELARQAHEKNICVLLSNHDTALTRSLYADAELKHFPVQRFISCKGDDRKAIGEILAIYR